MVACVRDLCFYSETRARARSEALKMQVGVDDVMMFELASMRAGAHASKQLDSPNLYSVQKKKIKSLTTVNPEACRF
jgi:hypothetical protein